MQIDCPDVLSSQLPTQAGNHSLVTPSYTCSSPRPMSPIFSLSRTAHRNEKHKERKHPKFAEKIYDVGYPSTYGSSSRPDRTDSPQFRHTCEPCPCISSHRSESSPADICRNCSRLICLRSQDVRRTSSLVVYNASCHTGNRPSNTLPQQIKLLKRKRRRLVFRII